MRLFGARCGADFVQFLSRQQLTPCDRGPNRPNREVAEIACERGLFSLHEVTRKLQRPTGGKHRQSHWRHRWNQRKRRDNHGDAHHVQRFVHWMLVIVCIRAHVIVKRHFTH